ncbi:MAG: hypothetical protein M2R45_04563 [Verrucomicrobia subdivision 3 bacterium]|nr:hypothetical protein [Limisphaerales bacterium]MCS1416798.1 hypothetical protein [Limisphaerales bacterium]
MDHNRDGRGDPVYWNEDHFEVHYQNKNGLIASLANTFTTDVEFDFDDLFSLAKGAQVGKVLHSLTDLNGDGIADLVVLSLEGRHVSSKQSAFEVHFGRLAPDGGTWFAPEIGVVFQSDGHIQLGMDRYDFDCAVQVDLMFTTIDIECLESSFWKKIKGFMGDDIWLDLEFYRREKGFYPDTPNAARRVALDGEPSHREPGWVPLDVVLRGGTHERRRIQKRWSRAFNWTLLIGDVTGDGRSDLLIGQTPEKLSVIVGVPGPNLFAPRAQTVAISMPLRMGNIPGWRTSTRMGSKTFSCIIHLPFGRIG